MLTRDLFAVADVLSRWDRDDDLETTHQVTRQDTVWRLCRGDITALRTHLLTGLDWHTRCPCPVRAPGCKNTVFFLAGCRTRRLNQAYMVYYCIVVYHGPFLCILLVFVAFSSSLYVVVFCLLVVLAKLSLLAKWLARKIPLRKPNCGEGIISIKPRLSVGILYSFLV